MADIVPLLWLLNIYQCIRWLVKDILLPISCSVFASYVFWHIASNPLTTKIKFAPKIEKSSVSPNKKRFRIKMLNIGCADIYEAEYIIQFSYIPQKEKEIRRVLTLDISQRFRMPVLYGKKHQKAYKGSNYSRLLEILEPKDFYSNFTDNIHEEHIVKSAQNKKLTLGQVFDEYSDSLKITVLVFGIDSFTGIRRFFKSQAYKSSDIVEGRYCSCNLEEMSFSKYVDKVLAIEEIPHKLIVGK